MQAHGGSADHAAANSGSETNGECTTRGRVWRTVLTEPKHSSATVLPSAAAVSCAWMYFLLMFASAGARAGSRTRAWATEHG